MSNNQSKLSRANFMFKYNPRKLSFKTRIEIIRKRHLVKEARKLLQQGMETPQPASLQDDFEKAISIEVLAEILERNRNYEKTQKLIEYTKDDVNVTDSSSSSSDQDNYESDNFETESLDSDKSIEEKKDILKNISTDRELLLIGEDPELVEL